MSLQETSARPEAETDAAGHSEAASMFGHYRLERELGRGCSSIVYAAHDSRRGRTVALKVLTFLQTLDDERRRDLEERFRREAQAVSTLSHPNIIAIYDVGQGEDGRQFIAMEYLPGETLRRRLNQASPLSVPLTVAIGVRVAEALHYAHGRGIIHRDVKPDNIFLAHNGAEGETPKLMDFGVAHILSDQALTQDGTIVGSPAYMSPEQIHGLPPDARTDVFSLAVTLTEMATGVKPFEAETIPALMQKILHQAPDLRAVADRKLQRVLAKALAKNPGARYPDAWAFAQALRRSAPFAVPAPGIATQRLARTEFEAVPARPHRRLSPLGVVGLGGLAAASLAALPFLTAHPPQASARMASPRIASPQIASPQIASPQMASAAPILTAPSFPVRPIKADVKRQKHLPLHHEEDHIVVRIVEGKPSEGVFSHPSRAAWVSHASLSPRPLAAPLTQAAPTTPARPRAAQRFETRAPKPVVRVAASPPDWIPGRAALPAVATLPDAPPRPLSRPMPQSMDGLDHPSALARLRVSVSESGDVTEAYILRSSGSRALDDAALDAVGRWEYAPAIQDGKPVPGVALETVNFAAAPSRREQIPDQTALATSPPRPLSRPMPHPADGLDRTSAVARVRLSVSKSGDVTEAYILRSSGSRALDDAALDAVGHWVYAPAVRDGKPVPGVALETVNFAPW